MTSDAELNLRSIKKKKNNISKTCHCIQSTYDVKRFHTIAHSKKCFKYISNSNSNIDLNT